MELHSHALQMVVTIVTSVIASSGFWAFLQKHFDKNNSTNKLLLGLAHDKIMTLGGQYLSRGNWITIDEYENLHDYLYEPYVEMGGNGAAKRMMTEVEHSLRIVKEPPETF